MTRCSICMTWFHDQCVGLDKDEPVGIWLCSSCREVPQGLQKNIIELKTEVVQLKASTNTIISTITTLSTQVTSCIEGIHDKLTAISNQLSCNDKKTSEALESLSSESNKMKTNFDQKTCQLLNKTTTIIDKLKRHNEPLNKSPSGTSDQEPSENKTPEEPPIKTNSVPTRAENPKTQYNQKVNVQQNKPSQPQKAHESETIDLTSSPKSKKAINQKTLLVGSSLLKDVKLNQLNNDTAVRTFSGATIETLQTRLNQFNIQTVNK